MPSYLPGQIVHGYEILDCLSCGGFATSYRARRGGEEFFLKEYSDPTEISPDFTDFIKQQEVIDSRLRGLKQPCVERLLDTFVTNCHYHQVKSLLNCVDLDKYLESDTDLDNRLFICRLWLGILNAISSAGIVHQDLKPAQILMVKRGGIKLNHFMVFADFDWGVVDGKQIRPVCTAGYITPEYFKGEIPTIASDLYQSGMVLYRILTERLPFYIPGEVYDVEKIQVRMKNNECLSPAEIQPDVPEWASDNVMSMLAWDMDKRPAIEDLINAWDKKNSLTVEKSASLPDESHLKRAAAPEVEVSPPAETTSYPETVSVAEWIRLRHSNGSSLSFKDDHTPVTRQLFHGAFRTVLADSGHPIAAYFPSNEAVSLFNIRKKETAWEISGSSHRNYGLLNDTQLEMDKWEAINQDDVLKIFSRNEKGVVAEFKFEIPE